uniref:Uncharacterized protein n=1 Tax=Chromera velia CCMP2878 TaxID=1169474 RepID=A0A0G4H8Q7_9ALVE|eukprot:Cvel_5901.t1-p1 / transcript=Cvel_5901.t1 / gene=Cvel_5901 / organism=Chromera_velia_CCMP2878 / gene_product=hypothetical protein / transcript_product=hypothetical protein / location=Cvel_scaffold281:89822-92530(-) / protein_length=321 / sequence_SO=supercontig / SO=protein_coding / is_pseudo=false
MRGSKPQRVLHFSTNAFEVESCVYREPKRFNCSSLDGDPLKEAYQLAPSREVRDLPLDHSLLLSHSEGNPLGPEGIRTVGEGLRASTVSCLHTLDLEGTGLNGQGLRSLCGAVRGGCLRIETINLSGNKIGGVGGIEDLSSVLCVNNLPSLHVRLLRECGLEDADVRPLAGAIGKGDLENLEVLDLGGNACKGAFLGALGKALCSDAAPQLKALNVKDARKGTVSNKQAVTTFLGALSAPTCPPKLQVTGLRVVPMDVQEAEVRALGACKDPSLRTLDLSLSAHQVVPFFQEVVGAGEGLKYEVLDLRMDFSLGPTALTAS